jgi:hypothetical protein
VDNLLGRSVDTSGLSDCTLTPNGQFFRTNKQGFLPELMAAMYENRTVYKAKSIEARKELEEVLAEIDRRKISLQTK